MTDNATATNPTTGRDRRKQILTGLLIVALLIVGWLGLKGWRVARAGQSLLAAQPRLEALADAGLSQLDPDEAERLLLQVRRDVHTLRNESRIFRPLFPYLGGLPHIGPLIVKAPALLDMGAAGTDAAAYALRGLKPALLLLQSEGSHDIPLTASFTRILAEARPDLAAANQSIAQAAAARARIQETDDLPWRVQQLFALADQWLPQAESALQFSLIAPEMMGLNGPRRYLVIAQNEDEARATGGFISGAGVIVVENGRIVTFDFQDAYQIDDWRNKPYDLPPEPLEAFMGLGLLLFRDANFWPDFPTSAEKLMDLYSYGRELPPLDGAVAVDQAFIKLLVEALGSVTIPEDNLVLTRENITATLRESWGSQEGQDAGEWVSTRKDFLGPFAAAIKDTIENDLGRVDLALLAKNMSQAVQTKRLQIYSRYPAENAVLTAIGWNGRLAPQPNRDFLAIVESNVGFNKSNLYVERAANYQVTLTPQGDARAQLTLAYTHTHPANDQPCIHYNLEIYRELPDYLTLAETCYWSYLRVYAPPGSQLLEATRHTIPGESHRFGQTWEAEAERIEETAVAATFATYFLLPLGESLESQFTYQLPQVVAAAEAGGSQYRLDIRQQAGGRGYPLRLTVSLPPGATYRQSWPAPTAVTASSIQFELFIDRDSAIILEFE